MASTASKTFKDKVDKLIKDYADVIKESDRNFQKTVEKTLVKRKDEKKPKLVIDRVVKWLCRLAVLYVLWSACSGILNEKFDAEYRAMMTSDVYSKAEFMYYSVIRKFSVFFGLTDSGMLHEFSESCIMNNPFALKDPGCCHCKFNITKSKVKNFEKAKKNYEKIIANTKSSPFLIGNAPKPNVTFLDIKNKFWKNREDFRQGYNKLTTIYGPKVSSLDALLGGDAIPEDSAVVWELQFVEGIRHFRDLVPRPPFIPSNLEISLDRAILFIGAKVPADSKLKVPHFLRGEGQMYAMGIEGDLTLTVGTRAPCKCKKLGSTTKSLPIQPGYIASFQASCYQLGVKLPKESQEAKIVYFGLQV